MSGNTIYIGDLPSAVVLAALYNNAVVKGFETRTPIDGHMSITAAQLIVSDRSAATYIAEWHGRVIGVDFSKEEFDPTTYNTANGGTEANLAQRVIDHVRRVLAPAFTEATRDFWVPVS